MTVLNPKQCREFLAKNEDRIILIIGFVLVAFLSFGAGKLSETYRPQTPIVFKDAPKCGAAGEAAQTVTSTASDSANSQINEPAGGSSEKTQEKIIGNKNSMIYHMPGGAFYGRISEQNRVYFNSEAEAQSAGYRKSKQ